MHAERSFHPPERSLDFPLPIVRSFDRDISRPSTRILALGLLTISEFKDRSSLFLQPLPPLVPESLTLHPRFARWPEAELFRPPSSLLVHPATPIFHSSRRRLVHSASRLSRFFILVSYISLSLSVAFSCSHLSLFHFFPPLLYQAEGGSGHERATTLLLDSDVVAGAEVRRISIGFEPDTGGRPKTP